MPASLFSLLTPLLLVLLGMGQLGMWWRWRPHRELLYFGLSLIAISVGVLVQLLWRPQALHWFVMAFTVCYLFGFGCIGLALAHRMRVTYAWAWAAGCSLACLVAQWWFSAVQPDLPVRVLVINIAAMVLVGLPLRHWRHMHMRNRYDRALPWLYIVFLVVNVLRMLIVMPLSQVQDAYEFTQTWFWMSVHVVSMAVGMLGSGCMFFAALQDVLDQLHRERTSDSLTGALNRRGWQMGLEQIERRHDAHASAASVSAGAVLLLDVDHFKQINDRFGHGMGDKVLSTIGALLQAAVGPDDLVCRYGGEEFVLLLVQIDRQGALRVAERMRQQVQDIPLLKAYGVDITVSMGLVALDRITAANAQAALTAADVQMYAAKQAGRNQVSMAA